MHLRSRVLGLAVAAAAWLSARGAAAQTVTATSQPLPNRIVGNQNQGVGTRPANLNPAGISYSDCAEDMQLQFSVLVSGFNGSQNMQIWASKSSDCTATQDRGIGTSTGSPCWLLAQAITAQPYNTSTTLQPVIPVRNIVGNQNASVPINTVQNLGLSACNAQTTFPAVSININFVPLDSSNTNSVGTAYQFVLNTDLVGPPPPTGVGESVGNTLFNVTWSANTDSDTTGYDIFIDPPFGSAPTDAATSAVHQVEICPDTGTAESADATEEIAGEEASTDSASDVGTPVASADATTSTSDAGCYFINVAGTGESTDGAGTSCNDSNLSSAIVSDAGAVTTVVDDAGDDGGTTTVTTGAGGISTIPPQFLITPDNGTGITVGDKTATQYQIKGLQNGTTYTVVVAAVDGYGNVGPPSTEVCDYPAPTQDFFATYKNDGGGAGGGFCALEAPGAPASSLAGGAALVGAVAFLRRRRRRGSR